MNDDLFSRMDAELFRLRASNKELLELLETVYAILDGERWPSTMRVIRAAIAKAKEDRKR